MMKRDQVARSVRHDPRARVAELADAQDLGSCPARGEGSNPSSRTPPSEAVRLRQNHASYKGKPSSTPVDPIPSSRQYPNESGSIRPLTATQNATRLLPDDPGLAAVVEAWPDSPRRSRPASWRWSRPQRERGWRVTMRVSWPSPCTPRTDGLCRIMDIWRQGPPTWPTSHQDGRWDCHS